MAVPIRCASGRIPCIDAGRRGVASGVTRWFPHPLRRHLAAGVAALAMLCPGNASSSADPAQHRPDEAPLPAPGYRPLGYQAPEPGSYTLPALGEAADGVLLDSHGTHQSSA